MQSRRKDNALRELRKQLKIESESGVKGKRDREAMGRKLAEVQERLIELETRGPAALDNGAGGSGGGGGAGGRRGNSGGGAGSSLISSLSAAAAATTSPSKRPREEKRPVADDVAAAMAGKLEALLTENVELKMKLAKLEA